MTRTVNPKQQRRFALDIVRRLRAAGFQALWAGGCVRDELLGRHPKDYDVATDARPEQIRQLFRRTVEVGSAFGVVVVVGPRHAGQIEVATFRRDSPYSDGRHPDHVTYSSAEEDARRRDFTINGLFYDPVEGRVIDYVGGQEDLHRRIVRAIGDPHERFLEDRLRMLRAVRFAACLDFALDTATRDAIIALAPRIVDVSAERISQEMRLILTSAQRVRACQELYAVSLLRAILPEAAALADAAARADAAALVEASTPVADQPRAGASAWQQTLATLGALVAPHLALALAALLHRVGIVARVQDAARADPTTARTTACEAAEGTPRVSAATLSAEEIVRAVDAAEAVCRRWKLPNRERETVVWLVAHQCHLYAAPALPWSSLQPVLADPRAPDLVALLAAQAAVGLAQQQDVEYCRNKLAMAPELLRPAPLLTGDDLLELGVPEGKTIGVLLRRVRQAQLDGQVHSREEAIEYARELLAAGNNGLVMPNHGA